MTEFRAFEVAAQTNTITYYASRVPSDLRHGLLIVVHGRSRSVMKLAGPFADKVYKEGFALLAPVFDIETYDDYQILRGRAGPCVASDALEAVCEDACRRFGIAPAPFAIIGFSGGAQFAHRYAMRSPKRVTGLVVASAGWYTMPNPYLPFPFGCAPSVNMPEGIQDLSAFLKIPIRVMVGENDVHRDSQLRTSSIVDENQGLHRLERARRWVDAISHYANERGIKSDISLEVLPNCGHSAIEAIRNGGFVWRSINFLANYRSTEQSI